MCLAYNKFITADTTRTLSDEEAEKTHKLTKDWPVICYPIFFHAFFLLHGLFLFSGQIQSLLEFLPGGNWIFGGEFEMFLISRLKKLYFPPRGIAFPPNQSGEIRFSLVGNLGKNNLFCSFFFKLELFRGEIFVLGNFPRRNSHFPHEKFPFPPFLSGETSSVVSHSSDLPKWKQIEKIN